MGNMMGKIRSFFGGEPTNTIVVVKTEQKKINVVNVVNNYTTYVVEQKECDCYYENNDDESDENMETVYDLSEEKKEESKENNGFSGFFKKLFKKEM